LVMKKNNRTSRRQFLRTSTAAAVGMSLFGTAVPGTARGANERIRIGFIGVGNRGSQLLHAFMANKDVEIAALCDVYAPYTTRNADEVDQRFRKSGRIPKMGESLPAKVKRFGDFRKMLEAKDIDAVCIATPDHWHAIQMIQSVQAGKDVYVEKPLTITLREGRKMVDVWKASRQIVQVGLNRRGSLIYQKLAAEINAGKIGRVLSAQAYRISDMYPDGIGRMKPEAPPADFDWDMWLGPRAFRPYQYNIAPYYFRWWSDYSSQMGNWGVHYMDVIRWMLGETAPAAICAQGGKYLLDDDRTIPDTMEVTFEFSSRRIIRFSIYEGTSGQGIQNGELELRGSKGSLVASERGYQVLPAKSGQFQTWKNLIEPETETLESEEKTGGSVLSFDSTANLVRNFLDCIKTRQIPWCTLEDGHRSTSFAHLANISLAVGQRIEWDAENERITNNEEANNLLHYQYRKPWSLG